VTLKRALAGAIVAVLAGASLGARSTSEQAQGKVFPEPKPDQALLYLIRPSGSGKSFVFADEAILAHLKADSYAFAYLRPGTYLIWDEAFVRQLVFVPNQVYYVVFGTGVSLLTEEEGKHLLAAVKQFSPFDTKDSAEGSKIVVNRSAKLKAYSDNVRSRTQVAEVPAPDTPAQTEGLLRVPAYSAVKVELAETLSSKLSTVGKPVAFRVAEDAATDGKVWLLAGTPVQGVVVEAERSGRNGWPGSLEVRIPAVPGGQGATIPAVGQLVSIGKSKRGAAGWAGLTGGLLGRAMVKGHDAELVAGSRFTIFTRNEAWAELAGEPPPR
jgi:hypothetical protein